MQSGTDAIADKDFSIKYLDTGSKEMDKLVHVFNDMIDQLREERTSMSQQSYFMQNLINATPLGIIILNFDEEISSINPSAKDILQMSNFEKEKKLSDLNIDLAKELSLLNIGEVKLIVINGIDKYKCQMNEVIHQGFKRKIILIDDLSKQLLESEKDAYDRIIRMMAHEVNNSMGAINSILDTVVEFGLSEEKDEELKKSLIIAKERNKGLSKFMANYASILRLPEPNFQQLELSKLLKKSGQLFLPFANENDISIEFDLPEDGPWISGDEVLLEQAISNILKNAIESIVQDGDIIIKCTKNPKGFVITDNGIGISAKNEAKLFTPFFSTKPSGQGVGLMLVRDILQSHKTKFSLKTDPQSKWTSFSVLFSKS